MKQGQFPAVLPLGSLNGKNGFKIDGENAGDFSGYSLNAKGDINGDGYADLLIGAYGYNSFSGRSYVVWGGKSVGSNGLISLSSINNTQGIKLDSEVAGEESGLSLSSLGDINQDGYDDFIIGAGYYNNLAGRSYVVYGGPQIGNAGLLSLGTLNGSNGFKIDGEANSFSGTGVSSAGDMNGDHVPDIFVAESYYNAQIGRSVVLFSGNGLGVSGIVSLASLSSTNGFKMDGESTGGDCGFTLNALGDVNQDGYTDLMVAAFGYTTSTQAGRTYVVFGGPNLGSVGQISLGSLNGVNGFILDGESNNDRSGWTYDGIGDINGDGRADMMISAYGHNSNVGRTYVVFGGLDIGNTGLLPLSSLNGTNGFKLDGEVSGDYSGYWVCGPGDVNGDGYEDILIGAYGYNGNTGRNYVVFGGNNIGRTGLISLVSLNGTNGFILDGEIAGDKSGYAVGSAGDINGDGVMDFLIGAPYRNSSTGRSYVVFGDIPPVLVNNTLSLYPGQKVVLSTSDLSAYDRNNDNATLIFSPTNVTHGYFSSVNASNISLTNFSQQQVSTGTVEFIHDGTQNSPSYDITVNSPDGIAWTGPIAASINFSKQPVIVNNQLTINQGESIVMAAPFLNVVDVYPSSQVLLTASQVTHGEFQLLPINTSISQFNLQQFLAGQVKFVQDGSSNPPNYTIGVTDPYYTTPTTSIVTTTFYRQPKIDNNQLSINQGETVILTPSQLSITDDYPSNQVIIRVSQVQYGQFQLLPSNLSVTQFSEAQLLTGQVAFTQDGSSSSPNYQISISDPYFNLPLTPAEIAFYRRPFFTDNQLTLFEGETLILTELNLNVTDDYADTQILFTINDCEHGQFELIPAKNSSTIQFTQQQVKTGQIQFVHDNQPYPPAYNVSVTDGYFTLSPVSGNIQFSLINKPPFLNNTIPSQVFVVGQTFNFKMSDYIFYDEQGKPLQLSAGLAGGLQLPSDIAFNPSTTVFTGVVSEPENYNVSVTATSVASLKTTTYFQLQIVGSAPQVAPLVDIKTIASILATLGGGALTLLAYLYRRCRLSNKREFEHPFANAVRNRLRLFYMDLSKDEGKDFSGIIDQMIEILKNKTGEDIEQLKLSADSRDQEKYQRYAVLFAAHIQSRVGIQRVYCGTSQELNLRKFKTYHQEIADAVLEEMSQSKIKFNDRRPSWCEFFCCRRPALILDQARPKPSAIVSMSVFSPQVEGKSDSKSEPRLLVSESEGEKLSSSFEPGAGSTSIYTSTTMG